MEIFSILIRNWALILRMTRRDVVGRYNGSMLGMFWSFFNPLVMLAAYSFVFGFIFKARWGVDTEQNFSVILFTGLAFHGLLAECLTKAPVLISGNVNFVKKVVFPLEILAWSAVLNAVFHFLISLLILLLALAVLERSVPITWLYLPVVLTPLVFLCLGVSWLLSSIGVYIRDVGQVMGVFATLLLFLCPILYPIDIVPEQYKTLIMLNPLSFIVEQARGILVFGNNPDWQGLGLYTLAAFFFAQLSCVWFMKTRRGFADVL